MPLICVFGASTRQLRMECAQLLGSGHALPNVEVCLGWEDRYKTFVQKKNTLSILPSYWKIHMRILFTYAILQSTCDVHVYTCILAPNTTHYCVHINKNHQKFADVPAEGDSQQ